MSDIVRFKVTVPDDSTAPGPRATLASLPGLFEISTPELADVAYLEGGSEFWGLEFNPTIRAVFLAKAANCSSFQIDAITRAATARGLIVVIEVDYVSKVPPPPSETSWTLADSLAVVSDTDQLRAALFEQLAIARQTVGPLTAVERLSLDHRQYAVRAASTAGCAVTLSGVVQAGTRHLTFDAVSVTDRLEVVIDSGDGAGPAAVLLWNQTGHSAPPPVHQSGRRLAWVALHNQLSGKRSDALSLEAALADLQLVRDLLGEPT